MTYSDPNSALLDHIVSQADASDFLTRLPRSSAQNNAFAPSYPTSPSAVSTPAPAAVPQARVLWPYEGQDAGDLSLQEGDIVEIIEETNDDWWKGRVNGRQGIFPASYVEKIQTPATPARRPVYKPFRAVHHGMDQPPSSTSTPAPEGQTNSIGLQEAPGKEEKKKKFGALGNTMAHSAAGGVGFGAGAAIGGGLVRAIF